PHGERPAVARAGRSTRVSATTRRRDDARAGEAELGAQRGPRSAPPRTLHPLVARDAPPCPRGLRRRGWLQRLYAPAPFEHPPAGPHPAQRPPVLRTGRRPGGTHPAGGRLRRRVANRARLPSVRLPRAAAGRDPPSHATAAGVADSRR